MDYAEKIDAETWDFIRKTADWYPADAAAMDVAQQREIYDRMCRAFFAGRPEGVRAEDRRIGDVPARLYASVRPGAGAAAVVYFHGGGFVVGGLESHDDVCAEICDRTGFDVVSVDYRMSPEHAHPAAFDDCLAATRWAAAHFGKPLLLVGDSAGGNLAAAVAHAARGKITAIAGQVLIYPGLGGDMDRGSYLDHAEAPMLTRDDILAYQQLRFRGAPPPRDDPTCAPLRDADFTGLPPTVIVSAECDPLSDDGRRYRDRALAAGGRAAWFNEAGLVHGYLRGRTSVRRARDSFERIIAAIAALGRGDWPF